MSIGSKHAYRFVYLKSEEWKTVRLEALLREGGKCQICGVESIFNDAHHVWYPPNIWKTKPWHLVVLCRSCHKLIHFFMVPSTKLRTLAVAWSHWSHLRQKAIKTKKRVANYGTKLKERIAQLESQPQPNQVLLAQLKKKAIDSPPAVAYLQNNSVAGVPTGIRA